MSVIARTAMERSRTRSGINRTHTGRSIHRRITDNEYTWKIVDRKVDGKAIAETQLMHFRRIDESARLASYFKTFVGSWQITDIEGNKGSMEIQQGVTGRAQMATGSVGEVSWDEQFGYDTRTKKWTCRGVGESGEWYSYALNGVPQRREPRTGDRWRAKMHGMHPDGRPTTSIADNDIRFYDKMDTASFDAHEIYNCVSD